MLRRVIRTVTLATMLLALAAPLALGATSREIIQDAISDGYIDGDYSLAELRAADRAVSPAEREYYGWDEAYAEAIRRKRTPVTKRPTPPRVAHVDSNRNGVIDASEQAKAAEKQQELLEELDIDPPTGEQTPVEAVEPPDEDEGDEAAAVSDGSDGGSLALLLALLAVPAAIIGVGVWRMQRGRSAAGDQLDEGPPASSFSSDQDRP
jgi:hypothetical protein